MRIHAQLLMVPASMTAAAVAPAAATMTATAVAPAAAATTTMTPAAAMAPTATMAPVTLMPIVVVAPVPRTPITVGSGVPIAVWIVVIRIVVIRRFVIPGCRGLIDRGRRRVIGRGVDRTWNADLYPDPRKRDGRSQNQGGKDDPCND